MTTFVKKKYIQRWRTSAEFLYDLGYDAENLSMNDSIIYDGVEWIIEGIYRECILLFQIERRLELNIEAYDNVN